MDWWVKTLVIFAGILILIYQCFGVSGLKKAAITFSVIIILLCVAIWFLQNNLLYMPVVPGSAKSPQENDFRYRHPTNFFRDWETIDVKIQTKDGVTLRGWLTKADKSQRIIVYFHQNAGNIGHRIPLMRKLCKLTHSDILLVAYRGYSDSTGQPTQEGLKIDAESIIDYIVDYRNNLPGQESKKKIYVYGRSLGGAVSIYILTKDAYANKNEIAGVILENTFTSISDEVNFIFPILMPFKFLLRNHWRSIDVIDKLDHPKLFIRAMRDEIVPTEQMESLFKKAQGIKSQYRVQAATHNVVFEYEEETYFSNLLQFFDNSKLSFKYAQSETNEQL